MKRSMTFFVFRMIIASRLTVMTEFVDCIDYRGNPNHLLVITIPQSAELHANQQDDVYYRMGDKSQKLNFDDRMHLMYAKGARYYEDEPVADSDISNIDMELVSTYCEKIGCPKSADEYIRQNKEFIVTKGRREEMSGAAILLFGKNPQRFFKRARVRFIRYNGEVNHQNERIANMSELLKGKKGEIIRLILIYLSSYDVITTKIGCELTGKSSPQVRRYLNILVDAGVLTESNSTKNKTYTVNPKLKQSNQH